MKTYIILLRGVMPTGKNKVPMAQLRQVLSENGFFNVKTWIQSGNVVLQSDLPPSKLEKRVHDLIKEYIGADLVVIVRTGEQLKKVIKENPFKEGHDISRVFYVSIKDTPPDDKVKELSKQDFSPEKLEIKNTTGYMYIPEKYGKGKLSNNFLEKKLATSATTRNFNTLTKLIELSKD